jgi:hypothetical protein
MQQGIKLTIVHRANLFERPCFSICRRSGNKIERCPEGATVGGPVIPEVNANPVAKHRKTEQRLKFEQAVMKRPRPLQLQRLATIGLDLHRDALLLRCRHDRLCILPPAKE